MSLTGRNSFNKMKSKKENISAGASKAVGGSVWEERMGGGEMVLQRIRRELDQLSERQQMVAKYILAEYEQAAFFTAARLAEASNVSEATVVRFANRMGYSRYSQLQEDLRDAVRGKLSQMDRLRRTGDLKSHSTMMQTVIRSMQTDIRSIEQTLVNLQEGELREIVGRIARARRVYVAGTHSEYGIACYFASTLCWIRDQVYLLDESHNPTFDAVADGSREDVIVALSFPPYPAATVRLLEAAVNRGVWGVAITDSPQSPIAKRSRYSLFPRDEKLFFADNSAPTVSLLSVILALVSSQDYQGSSARLRNQQRYWEEMGFYHQEKG